jgi:hypothetical protein
MLMQVLYRTGTAMGMMKDFCDYKEIFNVGLTIEDCKERYLILRPKQCYRQFVDAPTLLL